MNHAVIAAHVVVFGLIFSGLYAGGKAVMRAHRRRTK
jgi:hypothetical protein